MSKKLLQQALDALQYHTEQTRHSAIAATSTALAFIKYVESKA